LDVCDAEGIHALRCYGIHKHWLV